jgi:hypothetical protein
MSKGQAFRSTASFLIKPVAKIVKIEYDGECGIQYIEPRLDLAREDRFMKRIYRVRAKVMVLLSLAIVFFPGNGKGQQLPMKAYQEFTESEPVVDIARQGETNFHGIGVEKAKRVTVSCSWYYGDLIFELTDPLGNIIDSTSQLSDYNAEYRLSRFPEGIIQADFDLSGNYPPGIWTLEITTEDKTEYGIGYTIQVYHRNPELKTLYETNKDVFKTDEKVIVNAILHSGSMPVLDATVRAVIAWERYIIDTLILHDDGLHEDSLPNDGRYASAFDVSDRQGDYYVHAETFKSGENPFVRKDEYALMFIVNNSSIIEASLERVVDNDSNGLYDSLVVGIDFDLTNTNDYRMRTALYDKNDRRIAVSRICDDFQKGRQTIEFSFDGSTIFEHGANGPYFVKGLILADSCDNVPLLDSIDNVHTTEKYNFQDFEHGPVYITGKHQINELDIDSDGMIDSLILNFDVEFKEKSKCLWTGFLKSDENRLTCCRADNEGIFEAGVSNIRLSFSGEYIRLCPYDGSYTITVVVINRGHSRASNIDFDFRSREYKHTDFE